MIYTFRTPWNAETTFNVISATIAHMNGKVKRLSPGCLEATWRTQPFHSKQLYTVFPSKFAFYVGGDGIVRAVTGSGTAQTLPVRYRFLTTIHIVWNAFIESLLCIAPGVDFGLTPGVPELVAIRLYGDGTEQVFVSTTRSAPSWTGAVLGGMLFGPVGAIIGASGGHSYTSGRSTTRFSNEILAKARYSNGLIAEGALVRNSPAYHEIMVNMHTLSDTRLNQ